MGAIDRAIPHPFRTRRLAACSPVVWLDARYEHVRVDNRVLSMAVLVASGVRQDGVRAVLGIAAAADYQHQSLGAASAEQADEGTVGRNHFSETSLHQVLEREPRLAQQREAVA